MCSVGDSFGNVPTEISGFEAKLYKCAACGNEFKGIGKNVLCPSCNSRNVSLI